MKFCAVRVKVPKSKAGPNVLDWIFLDTYTTPDPPIPRGASKSRLLYSNTFPPGATDSREEVGWVKVKGDGSIGFTAGNHKYEGEEKKA